MSPVVVRPIPVIEVGKPEDSGCSGFKFYLIEATSTLIICFIMIYVILKAF